MLRETRARWLAAVTAAAVVALAALFAELRNPGAAPAAAVGAGTAAVPARPALEPARQAAGQAAFERLGCARCHALNGVGNPAAVLDGVGARLDRAALRDWTLGEGAAESELPRGVLRSKQRAAQDPELELLLDLLQHSR
jgi:hypothetical protein